MSNQATDPNVHQPRTLRSRDVADSNEVKIGRDDKFLLLARGHAGAGEGRGKAPWSLHAHLIANGLRAETQFWVGPEGGEQPLSQFVSELAEDWRGWHGARVWESAEGGPRLSCTHDGLGHVDIEVELPHLSGLGWTAHAVVHVDAGQLEQLATDLQRLLSS